MGFQWKMSFNPDPKNRAKEGIFNRKTTKKILYKLFFYDIPVSKVNSQKYLGLNLDLKLSFDIHVILSKVNRTYYKNKNRLITKISTSIT